MYSCGPPHMANQKQDGQLEHTYSSYVMIRDVTLKTCQRRWMIGRRGERGSGISVLAARHEDDDEFYLILKSFKFISNLISNSTGGFLYSFEPLRVLVFDYLAHLAIKMMDFWTYFSMNFYGIKIWRPTLLTNNSIVINI